VVLCNMSLLILGVVIVRVMALRRVRGFCICVFPTFDGKQKVIEF
jgi:hypothetical protein